MGTWSYKEPMCPQSPFTFFLGFEGERCFVIFLKVCHKWSLTECPEGLSKNGWSWLAPVVPVSWTIEIHSVQRYLGTASGSSKEDSLLRNEQRLLDAMEVGSSDRKEKDKTWENSGGSSKPFTTSGYSISPRWHSNQSGGGLCDGRTSL